MHFPCFSVSIERREYLKRKKPLRETGSMPAVEVKNLVKKYGSIDAVKDITFSINEGEIFGLIGPNGAGKTTTLRVLSTLLSINGGSVTILGHDLSKQASEIRKLISYLPEDAGAYKNLSGRAYLQFIANFFGSKEAPAMVQKGMTITDLGTR